MMHCNIGGGQAMNIDVSRRGIFGLAAAASLATRAGAVTSSGGSVSGGLPRFGSKPGEARLLFNENPYGPSPAAVRAMAETASKGCYYVDNIEPELTAMIARRFGVGPDQVVLGNGSSEVLAAVALAWGRKGNIVAPDLMFDFALKQVEPLGVKSVRVPLGADMGIDLNTLAAATSKDTALVHICNPNNPTAMLLDPATLRDFIRSTPKGTTVLVDEAYNELTDRPDPNSMIDMVREGRDVIITRTFSKIHGIAGLRVGYAISSPENAKRIRDHILTIGVNSAALAAALATYDDTQFLTFSRGKVLEGRALLTAAVKDAGLTALPSQANFLFVKVADADALQKAMAARGIQIRGAYGPWKQWSRVSTGRIEDVKRYAEALPELAKA
jgi:histidinol-phosphate aminotransferase